MSSAQLFEVEFVLYLAWPFINKSGFGVASYPCQTQQCSRGLYQPDFFHCISASMVRYSSTYSLVSLFLFLSLSHVLLLLFFSLWFSIHLSLSHSLAAFLSFLSFFLCLLSSLSLSLSSPQVGFLRFLHLLSSFDWRNSPLVVNLNSQLTGTLQLSPDTLPRLSCTHNLPKKPQAICSFSHYLAPKGSHCL